MAKLSPSTLNRILEELDTYELSITKKDCIRELVTAELARREGADRFQEFHKWIKQGDTILSGTGGNPATQRNNRAGRRTGQQGRGHANR